MTKTLRRRRSVAAVCLLAMLLGVAGSGRAGNPDALWHIVHDRCVPNQQTHADPKPCALVDLRGGDDRGYAILKDLVGLTQYLLIPVARLMGIESAELLLPGAPNYFADAWRERGYTERQRGTRCRGTPSAWQSIRPLLAPRTSCTYM